MLQDAQDTPVIDRHSRILDAAERCFVRSGFHRTTMQDVAAEAGMSPATMASLDGK
jgi:TetR/AcrR family transcriptional regulator, repressor for uid operon